MSEYYMRIKKIKLIKKQHLVLGMLYTNIYCRVCVCVLRDANTEQYNQIVTLWYRELNR